MKGGEYTWSRTSRRVALERMAFRGIRSWSLSRRWWDGGVRFLLGRVTRFSFVYDTPTRDLWASLL